MGGRGRQGRRIKVGGFFTAKVVRDEKEGDATESFFDRIMIWNGFASLCDLRGFAVHLLFWMRLSCPCSAIKLGRNHSYTVCF
jgi:hypothetical protein